MRTVLAIAALVTLAGCDILFPEDPRLGIENEAECIARLGDEPREALLDRVGVGTAQVVPTFTFDVTKMSADYLKTLIVPGSDETAGSRGMASTNETSTAVDNFMAQPVDEKGAFFFGRDPSLYRVRGAPVAVDEAVASGCARQLPGMRLISVTASIVPTEPEPDSEQESEQETAE